MDRERVIVYIDENTDDGMMWEELNQEGQMQVSVYDEELEYDVEYSHSIVVKSLQEHLADYTKQVINNTFDKINSEYAKRLSAFMGTKISVSTAITKLDEVLDTILKEYQK